MTNRIAFICAFAALALAPAAHARSFDDYPDTRVDYYYVSGTTAAQLREEMRRLGPNNGGANHATARAFYTFDWSATGDARGRCRADVRISTRIRFPRHTNPAALSPQLRDEWTRFIRALERHEVGHVRLAYDALPTLKNALEAGSCAGAEARASKVDIELRRKQEAFDRDPANRVPGLREVR